MGKTIYKFQYKVIIPHQGEFTGFKDVNAFNYWFAYFKCRSLLHAKYKAYKGVNVFVKRHEVEI